MEGVNLPMIVVPVLTYVIGWYLGGRGQYRRGYIDGVDDLTITIKENFTVTLKGENEDV